MPLIGLTGGFASGKSLVANRLAELGAAIIDCDIIAREVVDKGTPGLGMVAQIFGPAILLPDGSLDRAKLGDIIFNDEAKRLALEVIVHPLIREEVFRQVAEVTAENPDRMVIVDAPVLFESGLAEMMDKVMLVTCSPEQQRERGMARDHLDSLRIDSRIESQIPLADKEEMADIIIDNSGTPEDTLERVNEAWQKALQ